MKRQIEIFLIILIAIFMNIILFMDIFNLDSNGLRWFKILIIVLWNISILFTIIAMLSELSVDKKIESWV